MTPTEIIEELTKIRHKDHAVKALQSERRIKAIASVCTDEPRISNADLQNIPNEQYIAFIDSLIRLLPFSMPFFPFAMNELSKRTDRVDLSEMKRLAQDALDELNECLTLSMEPFKRASVLTTDDITKVQSSIEDYKGSLDNLQEEQRQRWNEFQRVQRELDEITSVQEDLKQELLNTGDKKAELENELRQIKGNIKEIEAQIQNTESASEQLIKHVEASRKECEGKKNQLEDLKRKGRKQHFEEAKEKFAEALRFYESGILDKLTEKGATRR